MSPQGRKLRALPLMSYAGASLMMSTAIQQHPLMLTAFGTAPNGREKLQPTEVQTHGS